MGGSGRYQQAFTWYVSFVWVIVAFEACSHGLLLPNITPMYCINTTQPIKEDFEPAELEILREEACAPSCPRVIVSKRFYANSIQLQYNLVCKRAFLGTLVQVSRQVGQFIGNIGFSALADRYGRKYPFLVCSTGPAFAGLVSIFCPEIYSFIVVRLIMNIFIGGCLPCGYVYYSELLNDTWRTFFGIALAILFAIATIILVGICYIFEDWRWIQLTIASPAIIYLFLIFCRESPRWLIDIGRTEEAIVELTKIAKINKLPTDNIKALVDQYYTMVQEERGGPKKGGEVKDLFSTKYITTVTLANWVIWWGVNMIYYGGNQYIGSVGQRLFKDYLIMTISQTLGNVALICFIPIFKRKWSTFIGNLMACLPFIFIIVFINNSTVCVILASIAIFGINMSYSILYFYTPEMFPTRVRNLGLGTSAAAGRVGVMTSAPVADAVLIHKLIPPILFFAASLMPMLFILLLPETQGEKLPESVHDVTYLMNRRRGRVRE